MECMLCCMNSFFLCFIILGVWGTFKIDMSSL